MLERILKSEPHRMRKSFFTPFLMLHSAFLILNSELSAAELAIPDNVVFERAIEFSNPDNQHLQLNLARPKEAKDPVPAILCIHGGGFRAGTRESYDKLCI